MILYHGSNQEIIKPNVEFSKRYLDFGKGFYLTSYKEQSEKWALRKAARLGGEPTVNVYELPEDFTSYKAVTHFIFSSRGCLFPSGEGTAICPI